MQNFQQQNQYFMKDEDENEPQQRQVIQKKEMNYRDFNDEDSGGEQPRSQGISWLSK